MVSFFIDSTLIFKPLPAQSPLPDATTWRQRRRPRTSYSFKLLHTDSPKLIMQKSRPLTSSLVLLFHKGAVRVTQLKVQPNDPIPAQSIKRKRLTASSQFISRKLHVDDAKRDARRSSFRTDCCRHVRIRKSIIIVAAVSLTHSIKGNSRLVNQL